MSESDQNVTANNVTAKSPLVRVTDRRRVLRPLAFATPLALLFLISACGSDTSTPTATTTTSESPSTTTSESPSMTTSESPSTTTSESSSGGATKSELTAVVGEGDAFKITLTDSTGSPVTSLKAGDYTVKVKDASKIHNFHLTGAGVEEMTTVPDVTEATWTVKFKAGTYTFKCDPHPKMTGTFTVK